MATLNGSLHNSQDRTYLAWCVIKVAINSAEQPSFRAITPVVFYRHPRRNLTLHDVVSRMCQDVGLPAPKKVEAMSHGPVQGAAESRRHSLGGRTYLRNRYTSHLRLEWNRLVPGPVLLGRGQYFGLGVMIRAKEAA